MIKRKRKAFTIVELVIVIAVIAILAAVLIPTFSSIINKANESADIQAVRQMNMALMAESAVAPQTEIKEVIRILKNAGYNATDKLVPVSTGHGFYWCEAANMITLIRDEGDNAPEIIFPVDNESIDAAFEAAKADDKKAINFGENKATESTDRTFYDLEPTSETYLPIIKEEEETAGGGDEITTATDLKAALEAGGTVKLGAPIELADPVTIAEGVTLDLAGNPLTLGANASLTINGNVKFTNGNIVITNTTYTEEEYAAWYFDELSNEEAADFEARYFLPGIETATDAMLTLNNVTIEGNRGYCNIQNYGTLSLDGVTAFTVNGGTGIKNHGSSTVTNVALAVNNDGTGIDNNGTATIVNTNFTLRDYGTGVYNAGGSVEISGAVEGRNQFVASGVGVSPIVNSTDDTEDEEGNDIEVPGIMTISGTMFKEAENADVSYFDSDSYIGNKTPIFASGGSLTLKDVDVTIGDTINYYSIRANSSANVTIIGGKFTGKFKSDNACITIKADSDNKFDGSDFSKFDVDYIRQNLCYNYDENDDLTWNSIVETENSEGVKSFTLLGDESFSNHNYSMKEVPKDYDVTMYLNRGGFYVRADIIVKGTLRIIAGDIRVGEDLCGAGMVGKIKVKEGGALYLADKVEFYGESNCSLEEYINKYVIVDEGGTVYTWDASANDYEKYTPTTAS